MKGKAWRPYAVFILAALAVGGLGAVATKAGMPWYEQAIKPPFTPPSVLFPIVWTILYILMGIGMARVWSSEAPRRAKAFILFLAQLAANGLWSVWFFTIGAYGFAFFWLLLLLALVIAMTAVFYETDRPAGLLQTPYILWCGFAAVLNYAVWMLN